MLYNLCSFVYVCTDIMVCIDCLENPLKMFLIRYQCMQQSAENGYVIKHTLIHLINIYHLSKMSFSSHQLIKSTCFVIL